MLEKKIKLTSFLVEQDVGVVKIFILRPLIQYSFIIEIMPLLGVRM